jgi:hypothetical protein
VIFLAVQEEGLDDVKPREFPGRFLMKIFEKEKFPPPPKNNKHYSGCPF